MLTKTKILVIVVLFQIMNIYDELKSLFITVTISFLAYIFFVSGLIVNFLQLCSCAIWPFNRELYRKINCHLAVCIWSRAYALVSTFRAIPSRSRIYLLGTMVVEQRFGFVHRSQGCLQDSF